MKIKQLSKKAQAFFIKEEFDLNDDINTTKQVMSTPLICAILKKENDIVKELLINKVNVNTPNGLGNKPLFYAAMIGNSEVVKLLLNYPGANVNETEPFSKMNALMLAVSQNMSEDSILEILELFVKHGLNLEYTFSEGFTLLMYAIKKGKINIVKKLLECKANVEAHNKDHHNSLHIASQVGHAKIVKLLMTEGKANVEAQTLMKHTPLYIASQHGHLAVVKLLVTVGKANVNHTDVAGNTALSIALFLGHTQIIKYLQKITSLEKVVVQDRGNGVTQTHSALSLAGVADSLREYLKVDPTLKQNMQRNTSDVQTMELVSNRLILDLCRAASANDCNAIRALVTQKDAPINGLLYDKNDRTKAASPLHYACLKGNIEAATLLIELGADRTLKTPKGKTPFDRVPAHLKEKFSHLFKMEPEKPLPSLHVAVTAPAETPSELQITAPDQDPLTVLQDAILDNSASSGSANDLIFSQVIRGNSAGQSASTSRAPAVEKKRGN